ncbi:MAG: DTW domain-containing protein [Verrucomicrobiales bacterium]|nr:DTW domain-containing protein [Verrucomicrobiales bacterium]
MSRSVVLAGTPRCDRCLLPPRWCLCPGPAPVSIPLRVDVLMHFREQWRPSSTGRLVERAVVGARRHIFRKEVPVARESVALPDRELWILHPRGESLDSVSAQGVLSPERLQILLLDGSWGETRNMVALTEGWGRLVNLPLTGESRYWLRAQQGDGRQSTVEALMGLLRHLGLSDAAAQLALHFELQVYASLQARGQIGPAADYLKDSPIRDAFPDVLERLHRRRPNELALQGRDGRKQGNEAA